MSQDTGSANSNSQKVDIDDIEVSILIIAKSSNRVAPAATFLNRRGWPTTTTNNLGRAIEMISDSMPDFVMVSYNYNHPALAQLPDMVVGTFNLAMIGFAEMMDAQTKAKLMSAKVQYRLTGQPSGPNIHRFIRKILADRFQVENAEDEATSRREHAGGADSDDESSAMIVQKGYGAQKNRITLKSIAGTSNLSKEEMFKAMERFSQMLAANSNDPEYAVEPENEELLTSQSAEMEWGAEWSDEEAQATDVDRPVEKPAEPGVITQQAPQTTQASQTTQQPQAAQASQSMPSPMQSALEQAMASSFPKADVQQTNQMVERVAVFPVNSSMTPGYLVVACDGVHEDNKFLRTCHDSLAKAFSEHKLTGEVESGFWIQIPQTEYWQWVKTAAKFSFALTHNQSPVGTAFFSLPKDFTPPTPSVYPDMIEIAIKEIATNLPVNFKAYLRLIENNKFYLYLRNGRQLMPEQKQRLINRNIHQFSVKTVDFENLRIFLATSHLLATIEDSNSKAA